MSKVYLAAIAVGATFVGVSAIIGSAAFLITGLTLGGVVATSLVIANSKSAQNCINAVTEVENELGLRHRDNLSLQTAPRTPNQARMPNPFLERAEDNPDQMEMEYMDNDSEDGYANPEEPQAVENPPTAIAANNIAAPLYETRVAGELAMTNV